MPETLLEVNDLNVQFATEDGIVRAVDGISLKLERGKVLGIVGESGSGKSVTAMTLLGLTRAPNTRFEGEVLYKGRDLLKLSEEELRPVRGGEIAMIFQDPMTSLNPVYRVGAQIVEMIQAQIVELINRLKDDFDSAVIFITHDLGVIAEIADEILVMYAGRVVEQGSARDVFYDPQMPYTWGLLGSIPRLDRPRVERLHTIEGTPPSLINPPEGCKFRPRCPHAFEKCRQEPGLENRVGTPGHLDRCWLDVEFKRAHRDETISPGSAEAA